MFKYYDDVSPLQDMYQYVLSKGVDPPFSLCVPHPRSLLMCGYDSVCPFNDVLIIVGLRAHLTT